MLNNQVRKYRRFITSKRTIIGKNIRIFNMVALNLRGIKEAKWSKEFKKISCLLELQKVVDTLVLGLFAW